MPILDGGAAVATSTKIVVSNPNQPVFGRINKVVIDVSMPGPQGPEGPPGDITADQDVAWEVNQIFGTDARKYGTLTGSATQNTTTLNTAFTDHENWSALLLPQGTIDINDDLVIPLCSGKILQGQGCNATAEPSDSGTRIVQNGSAKNVFRLEDGSRALKFRDFSSAYASQQTSDDGKAHFFFNCIEDGGIHDISFEDITTERGHRNFYCPLNGENTVWNLDFDRVRCWWTAHSVFELIGVGNPSNTFRQIFVSNIPGSHVDPTRAPVPTGPVFSLWNGQYTIDGIDIEGWDNKIYYGSTAATSIRGLHVEHQTFSGDGDGDGNTTLFVSEGGPLDVAGWIHMDSVDPGSFSTTYMTVFKSFGASGSVHADNLVLAFNTNLAGTLAILDGDDLSRSFIGPSVRQIGSKTLTLLPPTSFWDKTKYYGWNTEWVVPTLAAGWVVPEFYQAPRYRRVGNDVVGEGLAQNTSGGPLSGAMYVLPTHMRSTANHVPSNFGYTNGGVIVDSLGNVGPLDAVADDGVMSTSFRFSIQ